MYITDIEIQNFRSIEAFKMHFNEPAGWHVIIGDNGAGKTSVLQAIVYAIFFGLKNPPVLTFSQNILRNNCNSSTTKLTFREPNSLHFYRVNFEVFRNELNGLPTENPYNLSKNPNESNHPNFDKNYSFRHFLRDENSKFFSAGYGPLRRLKGGEIRIQPEISPELSRHLSLLTEEFILSESISWLVHTQFEKLENKAGAGNIISTVTDLINGSILKNHPIKLNRIGSDGVFFKNDAFELEISQLSDGYRSLLSFCIDIFRQISYEFGPELFEKIAQNGSNHIEIGGTIFIDEIDAHLHPSWQTKIGNILTSIFPNIQFIVTTHSPLICRACENGTIWRLAAPGSNSPSGEVTGVERDRLIWGNILDAYGTELFGQSPVEASEGRRMRLEKLNRLNKLAAFGKIKPEEEKERIELQRIFSTDDLAHI